MLQRTLRGSARVTKTDARRREVLEALTTVFLRDGFLHLSLGDMATAARCSKSTLYQLGQSKEQIVLAVVKTYFKNAAELIAARLNEEAPVETQIYEYLTLISEVLSEATQPFFSDLDAFEPAREIYQQNTDIAAQKVVALVNLALGEQDDVNAAFIGAVAGQVMSAIHRGEIARDTGLDDSAAYRCLAQLIASATQNPNQEER